jgi:hypothetical protein
MTLSGRLATSAASLVTTLALSSSMPAAAQGTAEERNACMGDAFRFCSAVIPDVVRIEACLRSNIDKLTPACRAEFQPGDRTQPRRGRLR